MKRKPVLIVQHAQHEHPAVIRRALDCQGIESIWLHPYRGERYPALSEISGLISLGGPMSSNDEKGHPWIPEELKLLRASVEAGMPTVGVCLGGQLMSRALGGEVGRNKIAEVGWFPIQVNAAGAEDRILGAAGTNPLVYHWHYETFSLPDGAELLASSSGCPRQAYRIGEHAYGFQFHPEADHQLVHEWLALQGIEEELEAEQRLHGTKAVQDADTQRDRAGKGEKASLKIAAAIGQLFQNQPYEKDSPLAFRSQLNAWATHRTLLVLHLSGREGKTLRLKGHIATLLAVPEGEFVIFREESSILWPIRLDFIDNVMLA
jgi:GMP synthase (glutamine-hydrolysing)